MVSERGLEQTEIYLILSYLKALIVNFNFTMTTDILSLTKNEINRTDIYQSIS